MADTEYQGEVTAVTNPTWNAAALLNPKGTKGTKAEAKLSSPRLAVVSDRIESKVPVQVDFQFASLNDTSDGNDFSDKIGSMNVNGVSVASEANLSNTNNWNNYGVSNLTDASGVNKLSKESDLLTGDASLDANSMSDRNGPLKTSGASSVNELSYSSKSHINELLHVNSTLDMDGSSMEDDLSIVDTFSHRSGTPNPNAFSITSGYSNSNSFSDADNAVSAKQLWQLPDSSNPSGFSSDMSTHSGHNIAPGFMGSSRGYSMRSGIPRADSFVGSSYPMSNGRSNIVTPSSSPAFAFSNGAMSSMIERTHNVQDRSLVPIAKRRRIDDDDNGSRNRFHGSGGGILSNYVKQKQNEGHSSSTGMRTPPTFAEIDLTGGI